MNKAKMFCQQFQGAFAALFQQKQKVEDESSEFVTIHKEFKRKSK